MITINIWLVSILHCLQIDPLSFTSPRALNTLTMTRTKERVMLTIVNEEESEEVLFNDEGLIYIIIIIIIIATMTQNLLVLSWV